MSVTALTLVLFFLFNPVHPRAQNSPPNNANASINTVAQSTMDDEDDYSVPYIPGAFPITPTPVDRQDYFPVQPSTPPPPLPPPVPSTSPPSPPPVPITTSPISSTFPIQSPPSPSSSASPPPRRLSPRSLRVDLPLVPPPHELTAPIFQGPSNPGDTPAFEIHDPMASTVNGTPNPGASGEFDFGLAEEMYFDEEGLGTLEKIYLFARSRAIFHRSALSPHARCTFRTDQVVCIRLRVGQCLHLALAAQLPSRRDATRGC